MNKQYFSKEQVSIFDYKFHEYLEEDTKGVYKIYFGDTLKQLKEVVSKAGGKEI